MAKDKDKGGFQSSAGLIRYFDSEDEKSIKIHPYYIVGLAVGVSAIVIACNWLWPT
jgi:preprotein translocase subunit Sec61beta